MFDNDLLAAFHAGEWQDRWAATAVGRYGVAQATIWLDSWVRLFEPDGKQVADPTPHAVAVFLHEYMHYVHNCSTLVGVEQLVSSLSLVGVFARTLDPSNGGRAGGQTPLDAAHLDLLARLRTSYRHFVMPGNDAANFKGATSLRVKDWHPTSNSPRPDDAVLREAVLAVDVEYDDGTKRQELTLSVDVIEEGLAYLYEELFLRSCGEAPVEAPFYPYRVLPAIVRDAQPQADAIDIFRLGLIALNATNPGVQLMDGLEDAGDALVTDSANLPSLLGWKDSFRTVLAAMNHKLDLVEAMYFERGLVEHGVISVFERSRELLERRLEDPFFELVIADQVLDSDHVFKLVESVVPCEVVLCKCAAGEHERDPILTFGGAEDSRRIEGRRAMHLQVHAMLTHMTGDLSLVSSDGRSRPCPYYSSCNHPTRTAKSHLCETAPWMTVEGSDKNRCWYANAMIGLVARIRLVEA